LKDPGTDGRTILNTHTTKAGCENVNLIDLAVERAKWQAVVDMVMNLQAPRNAWNCLTS
jgi:hypothetical protein